MLAELNFQCQLFGANLTVGDEPHKGFPSSAACRRTKKDGATLFKQASPPMTASKVFTGGLDSGPDLSLIPPVRLEKTPVWKTAFSALVVKFWSRCVSSMFTVQSVNSLKRQRWVICSPKVLWNLFHNFSSNYAIPTLGCSLFRYPDALHAHFQSLLYLRYNCCVANYIFCMWLLRPIVAHFSILDYYLYYYCWYSYWEECVM